MDTRRLRTLASRIRARLRRARQDYHSWPALERCTLTGCDCPCGYCRHDRRHDPGTAHRPPFDTYDRPAADVAADRHNRGER